MEEIAKQAAIAKIADECAEEFKSRWLDLGTIVACVAHRCQTED